jgi:N-acetylmuramoyl-L-alanine amidase
VQKDSTGLVLQIENPSYRNILYNNSGEHVEFLLKDIMLTVGGETLQKFYTEKYDAENKKYMLTFPSSKGDVGSGTFKINDAYIDNVEISQDETTKQTSLVFNLKDKYIFNIISRPEENNTSITVLKQFVKSDKLVVIDAGHGGSEPGALFDNMVEKDINLDISMRVNTLLKNNGVKTYMIREDDSFVGLYERTNIANKLNASLFISIHNNAYLSQFNGTETLYFPGDTRNSGISGKDFADILQRKMTGYLNTLNRGIVERPNLVVLKATNMTAALAEVAFITNDKDRTNLRNEKFKQNAAQAICDGVMEALGRAR